MKRTLVALLVVLGACSSQHYEFRPDESSGDGDPHDIECGIVEWVHSNGWSTSSEGVGRVCLVEEGQS